MITAIKKCRTCGETKPRTEGYFYTLNKNGGVYYKLDCIMCEAKKQKDRYEAKKRKAAV